MTTNKFLEKDLSLLKAEKGKICVSIIVPAHRLSQERRADKPDDEEVRKLVSDAYKRTKEILQQNKESLAKVADLLLKKEVIFKEDLENILGKRSDLKSDPLKTATPTVL